MTDSFENLTREVNENETVMQSAVLLLNNLSAELKAVKDDPVAIQALADKLDSNSNALAAAIAANTIAEDEEEPEPEPEVDEEPDDEPEPELPLEGETGSTSDAETST
jgi:primosomal protein N''